MTCEIRRLGPDDLELATGAVQLMVQVFEEGDGAGRERIASMLARRDFWMLVAVFDQRPVGCLTGHVLPMTRDDTSELFIYDLAVAVAYQRRGIGRALISATLDMARSAGLSAAFVPAENEDEHALAFYDAVGGEAAPVTFFTFPLQEE